MDLNRKVVLIVDDETDNLLVLKAALELLYGTTTHIAKDGAEALQILQTMHPALVLADLSMPTMNGFELLAKIKSDPGLQDLCVIAVTAHAMVSDRDQVQRSGFDGYLSKPLRVEFLLQDLDRALFKQEVACVQTCTGD